MTALCSRGWGKRCPAARGKKCKCSCGGANHGLGDIAENAGGGPAKPLARFRVEATYYDRVVIRDLGPWDKHPTITNDAAAVVRAMYGVVRHRRLFYYDSEGNMDELLHTNGRFDGFKAGPREAATT
jgi:hypothetical protein